MKTGKLFIISLFLFGRLAAQCPGASGDQTSYGTNDTWIGYVYDNDDFTNYMGFINEGAPGLMNFDQHFGDVDEMTYPTSNCSIRTNSFSIRYKLRKNFPDDTYAFTISGDDGYRLSLDGGTTWIIGDWGGHGYTSRSVSVHLNGPVNMVIEYFDQGGGQRITFQACGGITDETVYGTNNIWRGYVYDNPDFTAWKGIVFEGSAANPFFDQNFGGDDVTYNTSNCSIETQSFSIRYRLRKTFPLLTNITFLVSGDDGYRFSLDGGANWVINNWGDHVYMTGSYSTALNAGTYDMVVEYYDNGAANRVSFDMNSIILPVQLLQFNGRLQNEQTQLNWTTPLSSNTDHFVVDRSNDGRQFFSIGEVKAAAGITNANGIRFSFTDASTLTGTQYYRLRLIDKNGTTTYSETITIKNNTTGQARIYPTVIQPNTSLWLQTGKQLENVTITVTDIMGRAVMQQHASVLPGNQTTSYSLPNMVKGTYVVKVKDAMGVQLTQKIIVP
ncbi:hypothetical protein A4H97_13260 [Niastella yeongjuensis]|uniref:PA14 domain-containing protein n=1 Tax=Niastella yeongjuensis TaxID=354355 RepID=A0A1V9EAY6_9BACT|nr:T9SS type A sorting domain-containing protein [Niastella yeongjuensis]OQP43105.1 hypothetical protein A4H97_13260 [Niastella yeongjuensis]SEO66611.1 Por secretion system C-terminal sorting domain-containing protein [Niastella yeongjuensis]